MAETSPYTSHLCHRLILRSTVRFHSRRRGIEETAWRHTRSGKPMVSLPCPTSSPPHQSFHAVGDGYSLRYHGRIVRYAGTSGSALLHFLGQEERGIYGYGTNVFPHRKHHHDGLQSTMRIPHSGCH